MCLQYIDIKQKKLKQFYHNPRVGGSSPSSATIYCNIVHMFRCFEYYFRGGAVQFTLPIFLLSFQLPKTTSFFLKLDELFDLFALKFFVNYGYISKSVYTGAKP